MDKTLLVLGSNSFLATTFIRLARNTKACKIFTVSRADSESGTEFHSVGDAFDETFLEKIIKQSRPAAIMNFVGSSADSAGLSKLVSINSGIIVNLTSILLRNGMIDTKVFSFGSAAEYGTGGDTLLSEDLCPRPVSFYGISKLAQTAFANQFNRSLGFGFYIIRPFNITGCGCPDSLISQKICKKVLSLMNGEDLFLDDPEMERDYIDVEDCAAGLLSLLDSNADPGVYNLCSGRPLTLRSLAGFFMTAAGKHGNVLRSPQCEFISPVRRAVGNNAKMTRATGWVSSKPIEMSTFEQIHSHIK